MEVCGCTRLDATLRGEQAERRHPQRHLEKLLSGKAHIARPDFHAPRPVCRAVPVLFCFPASLKDGSAWVECWRRCCCSSSPLLHCFQSVTFTNLTRTQQINFTMCPASPARAARTGGFFFLNYYYFDRIFRLCVNSFICNSLRYLVAFSAQ